MLREVKIQAGVSIYDYANSLLGGFDNVISLLELNPDLVNIDANLNYFVTQELIYDDSLYQGKTVQLQLSSTTLNTIKTIVGNRGQSIYDLVGMSYCSFDQFIAFCVDNSVDSTNNQDVSLKQFTFDSGKVINNTLAFLIQNKNYVFATVSSVKINYFILRQDGGYLLRQDGGRFIRNA